MKAIVMTWCALSGFILLSANPLLADYWESRAPGPGARVAHSVVFTGHEVIVWGGARANTWLNDGARYDAATNTWTPISANHTLAGRWWHAAVWTGKEMIVWGGRGAFSPQQHYGDGARYNPATDTWTPMSSEGAPSPRSQLSAVWTGTEMIVWGGTGDAFNEKGDGARYNPETDTWTPLAAAPLDARLQHTAVWSGSEMIIFGGLKIDESQSTFGNGAAYNPANNTWRVLSTNNAPRSRTGHTAVWTGKEMMVWGGRYLPDETFLNSGGSYDPVQDRWTPISENGAPQARSEHAAVWIGTELIVWGGYVGPSTELATGGRYNPVSRAWTATTMEGAPQARFFGGGIASVWTGDAMFIYGGWDYPTELNTTALYYPGVTWLSPPDGATFLPGATISLIASVVTNDVSFVEFFAASTTQMMNLGRGTLTSNNVYLLLWSNAPAGTFQMHAEAEDNLGRRDVSGSVQITVATPVAATQPADQFMPGSARLNGLANPSGSPTLAWFEWGTSLTYGNVTSPQSVGSGNNAVGFSNVLVGLVSGTEYHFRALASNAFGFATGLDQAFNLSNQRPVVTTLAADPLTTTSARLRGQVIPRGWSTAAWFEWGTDTNYGNLIGMQDVGQGSSVSNLNVVLNGLTSGPNYHYRLVANNAFGAVYGADQTFNLSFILTNFVNFETAPVHPIALGPDGQTLVVCNLPDNRLEIFDVSGGVPIPTGSVPVGLDPVTARFASSNELWVVNHISSSVSIIDLASLNVIATLDTPAGPSDVVFAGNPRRAWISCSRTNSVLVVDPTTRAAVANIAIDGERPRAMATSPDGTKVYVAIFESGNGSTILGRRLTGLSDQPPPGPLDDSNGPYAGADPPPNSGTAFSPPINPALTGLPPRVSHIVRKNASGRWMDDNNADWTEWVSGTKASISGRIQGWDLPDRDLAVIDTATLQVTYARRLMNICMAVAVNPASGQIAVVGTDATNERRFEPNLKGVFLRINLALVDPVTLANRIRDLNPHLDYITRSLPPAQRALALGDPRGIEWNAAGTRAYVTGMGSRNLVVIDADGARVNSQPIDLGEGPTGMALDEARSRVYVWNRFSSTISVVDTGAGTVMTNISVFDPTPDIVRKGRRHLYDTRANSGLGIVACGSCHVDARMDRLAWDLGDPAGERATNGFFTFHPMKGPMVTQTLQDIITPTNFNRRQLPLHWRGDRTNIEAFNVTFPALLARDTQLTSNEMAEFKGMLQSISFPPNYLRTFSNTLPTSVALPGLFGRTNTGVRQPLPVGNAQDGLTPFNANCRFCHTFNQGTGGGASNQVLTLPRAGTEGAFKTSQLRTLLDRLGMDALSTNSRAGFGFMHDGRVDSLTHFLNAGFPQTVPNDPNVANLVAFMLCFSGSDFGQAPISPSQDVPASAGKQVTFAPSAPPQLVTDMFNLASRVNSRLDFIVRGKKNGLMRNWLLRRGPADFQSDRHGEIAATLNDILAGATSEFTAMLVPQNTGWRLALDRDEDGYLNASELEAGSDPGDPSSYPGRILRIAKAGSDILLSWQSVPGARYTIQWRTNWPPATWLDAVPRVTSSLPITVWTDSPPVSDRHRYYRVRTDP